MFLVLLSDNLDERYVLVLLILSDFIKMWCKPVFREIFIKQLQQEI